MKTFVQTLYDYNFTGIGTVTEEDNSDEDDGMTIGMVSDSQPHGDQQLVGYTDSESDEDEDEKNEIKTKYLLNSCCFLYLKPKFSRGKVTNFKYW